MEWGHFLQVIGSIFATAGLVMLMVFKYVIEAAVPSMSNGFLWSGPWRSAAGLTGHLRDTKKEG